MCKTWCQVPCPHYKVGGWVGSSCRLDASTRGQSKASHTPAFLLCVVLAGLPFDHAAHDYPVVIRGLNKRFAGKRGASTVS